MALCQPGQYRAARASPGTPLPDRPRGPVRRIRPQQPQVVPVHPGDPAEREPGVPRLGELQEVHVEPVRLPYAQALIGPDATAGEMGDDGRHSAEGYPLRRATEERAT